MIRLSSSLLEASCIRMGHH